MRRPRRTNAKRDLGDACLLTTLVYFLYGHGSPIMKLLSLKNHIIHTFAANVHFKLPEVTFRILKGYNSTGRSQHSPVPRYFNVPVPRRQSLTTSFVAYNARAYGFPLFFLRGGPWFHHKANLRLDKFAR